MSEKLDSKWAPMLLMTKLQHISKVKVLSFLMGLTLTFFIMASYVLMLDKVGLWFTTSPDQFRPVVVLTCTNVSSGNSSIDMKLLAKIISSKLEYPPRKVPDEKEIFETDSHLFSVIPRHFLPGIKSPCWYEEFSSEFSADGPYKTNSFIKYSSSFKALCKTLTRNFHQHLLRRGGKLFRLRCLPFFYVIGQPKCGTTDLFRRLQLHPEVGLNMIKEPHWWSRKRFSRRQSKGGIHQGIPLQDYLDLFDLTALKIHKVISGNSSGDQRALQLITGEASASTMWDSRVWSVLHEDRDKSEPPFLVQDFIHTVQPNSKIIIILRDPVERLYSGYLYFHKNNKSAEQFHRYVVVSLQLFQSCLSENSLRACVYNKTLTVIMPLRLQLGMYVVFLLDWLTVFHRDQILVLQLEHYAVNLEVTMKKIFDFLSVGPLSKQVQETLTKLPKSNTRRKADRTLGPMFPATRDILREFYQPFNRLLASVLNDKAFLWCNK